MSQPDQPQPEPTIPAPVAHPGTPKRSQTATTIATIWLVAAVIVGAVFIFGTQFVTYGGDAYTGIQNAVARGTNALGWLIVGTGVLGFVIATRD